jgi:transketolase
VFARQSLPHVRDAISAADTHNLSRRGAYVLAQADARLGPRRVTLLATGSEVALALAARTTLQSSGVATAVVSMPCWDLFESQSLDYRTEVLGRDTVRVACEAAMRFGWDRWLGERGAFVGMTGFGACGTADELYRHFGITAEAIVAEAQRLLGECVAGG